MQTTSDSPHSWANTLLCVPGDDTYNSLRAYTVLTGVAAQLLGAALGPVNFQRHEKWKYCGRVIEAGSVIMYDSDDGPVVGEVQSLVHIAGCYVLQHQQFCSGIVPFTLWDSENPQSAVILSSLDVEQKFVELNTFNLSIVTCIHVDDFGVLVV